MSRHKGRSITCYVINLDRSSNRLELFTKNAIEQGLEFKRIPAVDGRDIDIDMQERLLKRSSGMLPLGPGEMGCFLSHRRAWKEMVSRGDDWAFIAEDDLHFYSASPFFRSPHWIPVNAMLIKAETTRQCVQVDTTVISRPFGHELRNLLSFHGATGGYFVSRCCAEILLEQTSDRCDPVDHILFNKDFGLFDQMNIIQIDPAICVQDRLVMGRHRHSLTSTLDGDRRQSKMYKAYRKPDGLMKIWRELSRPFVRIFLPVFHKLLTILGIRTFKRIKFAGDINPAK